MILKLYLIFDYFDNNIVLMQIKYKAYKYISIMLN